MSKFVISGTYLFIDSIVMATTGWAYWLLASRLSSLSEVGIATSVFSLIAFMAAISQLGLEYTILKSSAANDKKILGTTSLIHLITTIAIIPVLLFLINSFYASPRNDLALVSVGLMFTSVIWFVARYSLIGIVKTKIVLLADVIGLVVKFIVMLTMISKSNGAFIILLSFLLQDIIIALLTFLVVKKGFSFKIGSFQYTKDLIRDGLLNMPNKISRVLIFNLAVMLLPLFSINPEEIARFYISLMISVITGSFIASIAFTLIPESVSSKKELSTSSLRVGLSLTVPLISALVTVPKPILSFFGSQYASASDVLIILSISIIPFSILSNAISHFNYHNNFKGLLIAGISSILAFLISFWLLVPTYQILGAAFSILISFSFAAIISFKFLKVSISRYVMVAVIGVASSWIAILALEKILSMPYPVIIAISMTISLLIMIQLKNITIQELKIILRFVSRRV